MKTVNMLYNVTWSNESCRWFWAGLPTDLKMGELPTCTQHTTLTVKHRQYSILIEQYNIWMMLVENLWRKMGTKSHKKLVSETENVKEMNSPLKPSTRSDPVTALIFVYCDPF